MFVDNAQVTSVEVRFLETPETLHELKQRAGNTFAHIDLLFTSIHGKGYNYFWAGRSLDETSLGQKLDPNGTVSRRVALYEMWTQPPGATCNLLQHHYQFSNCE